MRQRVEFSTPACEADPCLNACTANYAGSFSAAAGGGGSFTYGISDAHAAGSVRCRRRH